MLNQSQISPNPRNRTSFYQDEILLLEENETVEYKNYRLPLVLSYQYGNRLSLTSGGDKELVDNLKKQICGFLNNKGGRLYIGVDDSRKVNGVHLTDKQKDQTKNDLTNLTVDFYPKCRSEKIKVVCLNVKDKKTDKFIPSVYVIKIIVKQGDTSRLYSIESGIFKSFMRLEGQCVKLTAQEIEKYVTNRSRLPKPPLKDEYFDDPEPDIFHKSFDEKEEKKYQEKKTEEIHNYQEDHNKLIPDIPNCYFRSSPVHSRTFSDKKTILDIKLKSNEKSPLKKIKVKILNLDPNIRFQTIHDLFNNYSIEYDNNLTITKQNNTKTASAIIYFDLASEAIKAKSQLDGTNLNNKTIKVRINS